MRHTQIRNTLAQVREFHGQLAEYYSQLSDKATQQRIQMLLDYMSSHEQNLQISFAAYEKGASRQVLDTWVDCSRCDEILTICEQTQITPDLSLDSVVKAAMDVDRCLLRFYREIAGNAKSETARDVFGNLIDMEEAELRKLAFSALQMTDI